MNKSIHFSADLSVLFPLFVARDAFHHIAGLRDLVAPVVPVRQFRWQDPESLAAHTWRARCGTQHQCVFGIQVEDAFAFALSALDGMAREVSEFPRIVNTIY